MATRAKLNFIGSKAAHATDRPTMPPPRIDPDNVSGLLCGIGLAVVLLLLVIDVS